MNLYTKLKIFHFKDKLDSLPLEVEKILPPIHVRIKPTNMCNHNCSYCAYRADNLQLGKDMHLQDFIPKFKMMEIIDDFSEMGVKSVTFSGGGEPFYYPYFEDVIKKLSTTNIKFAAITNGSKLSGRIAELFAQYGTWIRVSIDGWDDESYANYRKVSIGDFSKVLKNMNEFKKLGGKCFLGVSVIVDKKNASHIYELLEKLYHIGVDSVKISPCIIDNDSKKNNQYHKEHFKSVKEQIQISKNKLESDTFEIFDAFHELDEKFTKDYNWCPYLQILPVIGADQNVYSCQDKAYNLKEGLLGSIRTTSFKKFWIENKEKFFRIDPSKHCIHHCVANEKNKMVLEYLNADNDHLDFV